jgi:hypothetical protein
LLIESRERFLGGHKNQLDELICKRLFGGLFITASSPCLHSADCAGFKDGSRDIYRYVT